MDHVKIDSERKIISIVTFVIGVLLFFVKFYAYYVTHSKAVLSDAMESIVNIISAIVSIAVVYYSLKPRDEDHPYGHGKIEYFASAFEGGAILFAGVVIFYEGLQAVLAGNAIHKLETGIWIVAGAGLVNGLLGLYLKLKGKRIHSLAMEGSGEHLLSDFYTSLGLVIGLFIVLFSGIQQIDSIIAMIVGIALSYTGFKLFLKSSDVLMDARDQKVLNQLGELIDKYRTQGMIRVHDVRVLRSGRFHHVDLHLVVPEFWTVDMAHTQSNIFEHKILNEYHLKGEFNFHLDPCQMAYCACCDLKDCPIRKKPFEKHRAHTYEELVSPVEIRDH